MGKEEEDERKKKEFFESNDGTVVLSLADEADALGKGSFGLTLSDGGGWISYWGNREQLVAMRDAINNFLERPQ